MAELCRELGVGRVTLYRYVGPDGSLRERTTRVGRSVVGRWVLVAAAAGGQRERRLTYSGVAGLDKLGGEVPVCSVSSLLS